VRRLKFWALFAGALATAAALAQMAFPPELERFFAAIRVRESKGHPWSIYDNTAARSYRFNSRAEAEQKARELVAAGHNPDLGLYQLNWRYQGRRPGVSLDNVFDPSVQESVARVVLTEFYRAAQRVYLRVEDAIRMAVGAYNNGRIHLDNPRYVNAVYRIAGLPPPYASEAPGTTTAVASAGAYRTADDDLAYGAADARTKPLLAAFADSLGPLGDATDAAHEQAQIVASALLQVLVLIVVLVVIAVLLVVLVKLFGIKSLLGLGRFGARAARLGARMGNSLVSDRSQH
jgi:hypothetical protein